jgi:site-specific recombinase XerD
MSNYKIYLSKDNRSIRKQPYLVRWYGEFDPTIGKQKRYSKSFSKRKDAELFIEQLKEEFDAGMSRDNNDISLKELTDKFISTRKNILSKSTLDGYEDTINLLLKHFCPTVSIKKIRQEDAEEFIAGLALVSPEHIKQGKEISDSTRSRHLRQCKKLFSMAVEWNYLKNSPFEKIKSGKIRKQNWHYFSIEEFRSILEKTSDLRTKALYTTMYFTGLRSGEALNLLWDGINIDFEHNKLTVVNRASSQELPPFKVKDYEERSVPMPRTVTDILIKLQESSESNNPFVFLSKKRFEWMQKKIWQEKFLNLGKAGEWVNRNLVNNSLKKFKVHCKKAGIKTSEKLNLHCLRKSYATNLANAGTPVHTLMKLMGHSSIVTTQKYYLHSSDANEKKAVEELEKMGVEGR